VRALIIASIALATACATTSGSSTDKDTGGGEKSSGGGKSNGGGQKTGAGGAEADTGPQINSKAKLGFEDAVKALDAQQKGGKVDYAQLDERFKHAAEADENLAEAVYDRGVIAEKQGKTKEAIEFYKDAIRRKPSLYQAAENIGVIAQNQGNENEAQKIYENIISAYPEAASPRARLAEIARRHGESEKAIQLAKEALFRDPKTLQAYKTMMLVNYEQKQFSMARLCALRATKIQEGDPEIFYTLGLINLAEKEPAKARVQFKNAVGARPDFLPAHLELAKMAMVQEDYAGAEESLRQILRTNGKNVEALIDLGVALKGTGQYDKALEIYDQAQKINPNIQAIYFNRGLVYAAKGDCPKALELYKAYIAGGEPSGDHGVYKSVKLCEAAIAKAEEDKKAAEEAAKMEAEMKKQEDAQKAQEKSQKEEDLKKTQSDAKSDTKGGAPPPAEAKKEEPKKAAPAPAPEKKAAPAPAPAPAKRTDEPSDG
jgi:tetratricopeptide (TPR) repeat protein